MLTIFGPIQWAFSLLPKWEGAWAKWLTRYLTVHFYGAMLYFVGFYVLLLFDIVLCIQVENLTAITASEQTRGVKVPEPRSRPCGMDDTGRRHRLLDPKLRRGRGTAGEDDGHWRHRNHDTIRKD